ncbi:hypothetical protein M409DRAFT_29266 [Zasmidium cellare ATCC 36951]|uniref:Heterokaryon incompatibility domain-containing protein n=1 Tax=Zasmidium cellare ATCC 36951 TaxID=1080233 RepID=A0A6A6BZP7_ZASCE|nr:uncharacterized protein M409DRAFT_29266 [Zasmidium cellare ATCC 36951]KAF2160185.1 hypothetical protein M409DRAFT_29266 [Zasmidium cellare ATCC 36951]
MGGLCTTKCSRYEYSPLRGDEIRFVRLQPGSFDDVIRFELVHHPLRTPEEQLEAGLSEQQQRKRIPRGWREFKTPEGRSFYECYSTRSEPESVTYNHPEGIEEDSTPHESAHSQPYEALSYTWGDTSYQQLAFVLNGDEDPKTVSIRRNLATALRHLRLKYEVRSLWVDAVCINQDDLDERAVQVKRIRYIYGLASRVVVWLGESSHGSSGALKTLEYLGRQTEITTDAWIFRAFDPPASEPSWIEKATELPYTAADWQAIEYLFERSWFSRLWVLQEVTANPNTTIQCGQDSIDWYFLRRAIIGLDERVGVPAELSYRLNGKVDIAFGSSGAFAIVHFVARQHLCQDPRDKLYGILGLVGPKLQDKIVPSYERTFEDLYKDVFLLHSEMTGRLDLLTQCFVNEELPSSPSWVPDWRAFPYAFRVPEPGYQASGASRAEFRELPGSRLEVIGILHDKVVFAPDSSEVDAKSLLEYIRALQPPGLHNESYVTGEPLLNAWFLTLALDLLRERFPKRFFPHYAHWEKTVLEILGKDSENKSLTKMANLTNTIRDTLTDMGYFRTAQGYIGFGPYAVEPDDHVCVVLGVPTPMVIRPSGNNTYQVIGWAYVHGLMDSEAL